MRRTTVDQRRKFHELHQSDNSYEEIAEHFGVSKECVRYWCRRQRDGKGCETYYHRAPTGLLSHFALKVRYVILRLRLEHPRRGPNRIRAQLKKRPSLRGLPLPSEASIGRYLPQWRRFRRKPKKKTLRQSAPSPTKVHQCWQIDFKVGIRLANGLRVNLHTVRDPVGEAYIGDFVYATGKRQGRVKMKSGPSYAGALPAGALCPMKSRRMENRYWSILTQRPFPACLRYGSKAWELNIGSFIT